MTSKTLQASEQAVVGTLMIDHGDEILSFVLDYLSEDDFSDDWLRSVYSTIRRLYSKKVPIDIVSVSDHGGFEIGQVAELARDGFIHNCRYYAKNVKMESYRRKAIAKADTMIRELATAMFTTPDEVVDYMNNQVAEALPPTARSPETMAEIIDEILDTTEKERNDKDNIMRYGFRDLDGITGGIRPAELTIIAAGPGTGKTAFMMHMAANVARRGKGVLVFSREMHRIQVAKRVIASVAVVNAEKIRDGRTMTDQDFQELAAGAARVRDIPIMIDSKTYTIEAMYNKAMRYKEKGRLSLLCIDYFQLLNSTGKFRDRRPELEHISRQLKLLSLELEIPIILLSQINRESRKGGKAPELHDLRETGALEQDADNVIFIWDPNEEHEEQQRGQSQLDVEILIRKQRSGRVGKVKMRFDKEHQRFLSLER